MVKVDPGGLTRREREVVQAAATGADTRAIADRLSVSPRTVEHHLSSAYRKLGVTSRAALVALVQRNRAPEAPVTRYARTGEAHIAYQVIGDGPRDLIMIPGFVSNVDTAWTWPAHARFLRRLATGRRLIVFDKRGTGLSDPVADPSCLTLEQRMDEVRAVMDAAASPRAALFGFSEGAALSMLFAASYPARTNGLVLYGGLISPSLDGPANAVANVFADPAAAWQTMRQVWGTGQFLAPFAPTAVAEPAGLNHAARFERHGASPAAAYSTIKMAAAIEARALCPAVQAPCLVLHRGQDTLVPPANSRYLAGHLPDARYVELAGPDHPPWIGKNEQFFSEVDSFLSVDHPVRTGPVRVLRAVLVADPPPTPPLLPTIERFRGRPTTSHHGILYMFEGAVRAVQCALALVELQPALRVAVHAGELAFAGGTVVGAAVDLAADAVTRSGPGNVTITGVVKDLALGAGLKTTWAGQIDRPTAEPLPLFTAVQVGVSELAHPE